MPPSTLAPLTAAGLLITDACPARCRHCYVCAGPDRTGWMTVEAAAAHLAALARLGVRAEEVHIGGGEPFLDFDRLRAIVAAARDAGLAGIGYVETSGFWATSDDLARQRLRELAGAGMMQLSISADPYHQEFVPPEPVQRLYAAAKEVLGPGGVRARRWKWLQNARDVSALPEPQRQELFRSFLRRYPERLSGRAARQLAHLAARLPVEQLVGENCRAALLESRHVHIDPAGWVYPGTCAGIVLGQAATDRPLDAVLRAWRATNAPMVAALTEGGPTRLLDSAAHHGFTLDPLGYAGKCHLCWTLREHLMRVGAGGPALQPEILYLTS